MGLFREKLRSFVTPRKPQPVVQGDSFGEIVATRKAKATWGWGRVGGSVVRCENECGPVVYEKGDI